MTETTLGAAIPVLNKIPKLSVFNSVWINNLVKQIGFLGNRGDKTYVKIVTTNENAYSKALELFKGITRNSKSISVKSDGVRVTDMGGGNLIRFRPQTASSSGFEAAIDLDFCAMPMFKFKDWYSRT